jgi:tetratricopeptide (TPR) repeat protein
MSSATFSILGDNPATLSNDTLSFNRFVEPFAERLKNSLGNTPFTVGIYADWGQGKTTVMRMLEDTLRQDDIPTVWFDPWRYNTREAVWKGLALTLVEQVRRNPTLAGEIRRKRQGLKELAAKFLTSRLVGKDWAEEIVTTIRNEPWSPSLLHEFEEQLATLFEIIEPNRKDGINRPLILFVDDLDRCLPEPTLAVLEALKLVLSKPGLITIMGFAEDELTQAVSAAYAKDLDLKEEKYDASWGGRYIKKIIQMPFPLPVISERSFEAYVLSCLQTSQVAAVLRGREERWCGVIRRACEGNLREVKRFINNFISEIDKADANASALGMGTSFDPPRVAFILLLAWRFRPFLNHIRVQVNDPKLLIRYQLVFSQMSPAGEDVLRDSNTSFVADAALRQLFHDCFDPPSAGEPPLVPPFADEADLEPYMQFGSRTGRVPIASAAAATEKQADAGVQEALPRLEANPEITRYLDEARALLASGNVQEAASRLQVAEAAARTLGDRYGLELVLGQLGLVREFQGDSRLGIESLQASLVIAREVGDRQGEMNCLIHLARLSREIDRPAGEVLGFLGTAQVIAAELGDRLSETTILLETGLSIAHTGGDSETALSYYEKALQISRELGHRPGQLSALVQMGDIFASRADGAAQAEELYQRALRLTGELDDPRARLRVLPKMGAILEAQKRPREALGAYVLARDLALRLDDKTILLPIGAKLAQLYEEIGNIAAAAEEHLRTAEISDGLGETKIAAEILRQAGSLYEQAEKWEEALDAYRRSSQKFMRADDLLEAEESKKMLDQLTYKLKSLSA